MITTDKVFDDPQVAKLANAAQDGDLDRIQQLIQGRCAGPIRRREGLTVTRYACARPQRTAGDGVAAEGRRRPGLHALQWQQRAALRSLARQRRPRGWSKGAAGARHQSELVPPPSGRYQKMSMLQETIMGRNLPVINCWWSAGPTSTMCTDFGLGIALCPGWDRLLYSGLPDRCGNRSETVDGTSPEIKNPRAVRRAIIEKFCHFDGGRRGDDPARDRRRLLPVHRCAGPAA